MNVRPALVTNTKTIVIIAGATPNRRIFGGSEPTFELYNPFNVKTACMASQIEQAITIGTAFLRVGSTVELLIVQ